MPLALSNAFSLFTGGALLLIALALLVTTRRRSEDLLLTAFLAAVGINFVAVATHFTVPEVRVIGSRIAFAALLVDPLFLLAFLDSYPYRRQGGWTSPVLALLLANAVTGAFMLVFVPDATVTLPTSSMTWWQFLAVAGLAVGYTAAWVLVVERAANAPAASLRRRGAWAIIAVGVAIPPRLALLPIDIGVRGNLIARDLGASGALHDAVLFTVEVVPYALLLVATLGLARFVLGRSPAPAPRGKARAPRVRVDCGRLRRASHVERNALPP